MPKTIEGVPESITREQYAALVAGAGLDPDRLIELRFGADGIYATVAAADENGHPYVDSAEPYEIVKHEIHVRVVD